MTREEKRAFAKMYLEEARKARAEARTMPSGSPGSETSLGEADACRFVARLFLRELRKRE